MSRIYQALKTSREATPGAVRDLVEADQTMDTAADCEASCSAAESAGIDEFELPPSISAGIHGQGYRTISLRLTAGSPVLPFDGVDQRAAEQYRILRTEILQHPVQPKMIAISSANPGDGKTVTAVNIAGILALKSDSRVLIVDADMRQCSVAKCLGIPAQPGLSEVLNGTCSPDEAIVQIRELPNLHVLTAGAATSNPAELLDSARFRSLTTRLRSEFPFVIFDTTPTAVVADYKLVQQVCDGVMLIVRPDHTNRTAFSKALQIEPEGKLLGVVVNAFEDWFLWKTNSNYGYYLPSQPLLGSFRAKSGLKR